MIADGGQQIQIREAGTVRENQGVGSMVAEAMRRDIHLEVELQRAARLERRLRGIDSVAELVIQQRRRGRAVQGDGAGLDPSGGGQMDGVDWRAARVREDVGAADLDLSLVRIDLHAKAGTR